MVFAMDPPVVKTHGAQMASEADSDLSNSTPLVYSVIVDKDSMPSILLAPLTQFYQNLNDALSAVFNQRYNIGQALQGAALNTDLNELKTQSSFNNGMLPIAPN